MKLSNTQIAIICLIAANIIWGAAAPIFKWTLQEIDPFTFGFLRFFFSALIILPFAYKHLHIKREDIYTLVFLSVIGLAFRIAYNFYGLTFAPSINELIITSTAPVFILIGAMALLHEKARKKLLLGMGLSFFGVVAIIAPPAISEGVNLSFMGNLFFLVAMCLSVVYILLLKELAPRYKLITLLFWTFSIASITLFPFAAFEAVNSNFQLEFTTKVVTGIVFAVLFSTVLAHFLNMYGVKYIKASEVGLFSYVDPFIGIAIAQPLLGEQITTHYLLGAAMVFLGIFIAENRIHYHPVHMLKVKPAEEKVPVRIE
jgi:drug/metabolite transporter (DMT)-like permease